MMAKVRKSDNDKRVKLSVNIDLDLSQNIQNLILVNCQVENGDAPSTKVGGGGKEMSCLG